MNNKGKWIKTYIITFFSFVFTSVLVLSLLSGLVFLNTNSIVKAFSSDTYIDGIYSDVSDYANDMCLKYSVDTRAKDVITKEQVKSAVNEYFLQQFKGKSTTSYKAIVAKVSEDFANSTKNYAPNAAKDDISKFQKEFNDYFTSKVEFPYAVNIGEFCKSANKWQALSIAVSLLAVFALFTLLYKITNNKRLTILLLGDSVMASGFVALAFAVIAYIIKTKKNFYFFPTYFSDLVTKYAGQCLNAVFITGALLIVLAILLFVVAIKEVKKVKDDKING